MFSIMSLFCYIAYQVGKEIILFIKKQFEKFEQRKVDQIIKRINVICNGGVSYVH